MWLRSAFQREGATTEKALSPQVFVLGPEDFQEVDITGPEGAGGGMMMKEVRAVGGSQVVECLVDDEEYFEIDSLFDREPVKDLGRTAVLWSLCYEHIYCSLLRTLEAMP